VFTPKSLLREPFVSSPIEAFTSGNFKRVLPDTEVTTKQAPARILLTAGKIGVDLLKERAKLERDDFAVIRVEQLYPLPHDEIEKYLSQYPKGTPVYWVQEEPRNMGSWYFIKVKWDEFGLDEKWPLKVVCRPESASPSTGSKKAHKIEQEEIMQAAMGVRKTANA
jgi:2-oxoglutarate dehydrogenase E1 component